VYCYDETLKHGKKHFILHIYDKIPPLLISLYPLLSGSCWDVILYDLVH
jgi:hypothetical protein